jgi:hypothetical protein
MTLALIISSFLNPTLFSYYPAYSLTESLLNSVLEASNLGLFILLILTLFSKPIAHSSAVITAVSFSSDPPPTVPHSTSVLDNGCVFWIVLVHIIWDELTSVMAGKILIQSFVNNFTGSARPGYIKFPVKYQTLEEGF